ncbi:YccS family putative transporter [Thaumasiovibrio sp. DFM-14]|uniref:YccS family putative transporter n=1 Tax=Thaumasiovibrio sp. DFM-14 TaxID=3384792 RepID=UPI0039A28846
MIQRYPSPFYKLINSNEQVHQCIKVLIAILGIIGSCGYFQHTTLITPFILGIIAAALAESDANLKDNKKILTVTLACFSIAAFSTEILFPYPWLFVVGLGGSAFIFIMLGAMGRCYQSIAFASLLLAVYTMLDAKSSTNIWQQPIIMLLGASWYGAISICWRFLFPLHPLRFSLAQVFSQMGTFFQSKSQLFYPLSQYDVRPLRLKNAQCNGLVVSALNQAKTALIHYKRTNQRQCNPNEFCHYFTAQDIHERLSASHYLYHKLAHTFQHSDILFRFERLLQQQALACHALAKAVNQQGHYHHSKENLRTLNEVKASLLHLRAANEPHWQAPLNQLEFLYDNLFAIDKQLSQIALNKPPKSFEDYDIADDEPRGLKPRWRRVKQELHLNSPLFRHAIRLSTALMMGYASIHFLELDRGYWILLTILFVCQQSYSATRRRMKQRIAGTLSGLIAGGFLLVLLPTIEGQLTMITLSGVLFFYYKQHNYALATFFITLLVLACFQQAGEGFAIMLPRLIDTLIGCTIAIFAINVILPDWHNKRILPIMANTIAGHRQYLAQTVVQYRWGKSDTLTYRVARRNAHNNDVALNAVITNMLSEPERHQLSSADCYRFMCLSNAMLSYISTIGAHRIQVSNADVHKAVTLAHRHIHRELKKLQSLLEGGVHMPTVIDDVDAKHTETLSGDNLVHLVQQQLELIDAILPEMFTLARQLQQQLATK